MKQSIACAVVACAISCVAAASMQLSPSEWMDTETSTNCPFAFGTDANHFAFSIDFVATASNNVQVAFGTDSDSDGALSPDETGLLVAWDCGSWRICGPAAGESFSQPPATEAGYKRLEWDLRNVGSRIPSVLRLTEDGSPVFQALHASPRPWFYDSNWNIMRLTARGIDDHDAEFSVRMRNDGTRISLR